MKYWFVFMLVLIVLLPLANVNMNGTEPLENENKLIIYTYNYFFGLTEKDIGNEIYQKIFGEFEERYNVTIEVRFFDGARNIYLTALQEFEAEQRTADLLIGIDNVLVQEAKKKGLLEKLDTSKLENLSNIRDDLIQYLDPELYAVPYDYGPIAFIYDSERINITELKFEDFYDPEMANKLVTEDPTTSTTGVAFLMWQIGIYEKLLKKDWKEWWSKVKGKIDVQPSWGAAYFDVFMNEEAGRPIVVSYLTSPVYHYLYENTTRFKPMLVKYDGSWYAWYQIQAIGIVKNSPMKDLAYKFIDWLLSDEIQSIVYKCDIMLPAHKEGINKIPEDVLATMVFNLTEIKAVNSLLSVNEIAQNIDKWLEDWKNLMTAPSAFSAMYLIITVVVIVAILVAIYVKFYRRKLQ